MAELLAQVGDAGLGATVVFLGSVRRGPDDGPVVSIEYSAYEEMAEAECDRIIAEATTRWPGVRLAVQHRLGVVPKGAASIGIAAAMPHRAEAFAACRYVIEAVKQRLPVWKRETLDDGTSQWREGSGRRAPAGSPGPGSTAGPEA